MHRRFRDRIMEHFPNLGPLLFLIYFSDLPEVSNSPIESYADDTTITCSGRSVLEVEDKLTSDCERICQWMKSNKLKLNAKKTHILTMGTQQRLSRLPRNLEVTMDNVLLKEAPSKSEALLGCIIDSNLKWKSHIDMLTSKLVKRLSSLSHLRYICPFKVRKTISKGLFNSVIVYCLPVFGGMGSSLVKDIQKLQNKAARVVCNVPIRYHRQDMFDQLGWMTINQLIFYHTALMVFKIRRVKEPEYLADLLCRDNRNGRILVPQTNLTLTKDSFCFRGPLQWNSIPSEIRDSLSIGVFKKKLRYWIMGNVPKFSD